MRRSNIVPAVACLGAACLVASCAENQITEATPEIPEPLASASQTVEVCETIDFDEFGHGDEITSVSVLGMSLTVEAFPWVDPPIDPRAYDTNTIGGPDPDLEWQGAGAECAACQGLDRVIIIPDNRGFDIEGDDHEGGPIQFSGFTAPVFVQSWKAVDNDENPTLFQIFDGGSWTTVSQSTALGNGTVELVSSPVQQLFDTSMRFALGDGGVSTGSGAVDEVVLCRLEERDGEGCTLGYWKTHNDQARGNQGNAWLPTGFSTSTLVSSVFDVPAGLTDLNGDGDLDTLLEALNFSGGPGVAGGARILLKQAVASLLNASHPDVAFGLTSAEVIDQVDGALASGDRATMIALAEQLDSLNNAGCPLN